MNRKIKLGIFFLLIVMLSLQGCSKCDIEIIQKAKSPDGKYIAYAHVGNSGATGTFTPSVYIIESSYNPNEQIKKLNKDKWNIFFSKYSSNNDIKVEWENENKLKIICPKDTKDIYFKCDVFNGIQIKYENIE